MPLSEVDCICPNQHPLWYLACVWKASFTLCFTNKPLQQFINLNSIRECDNNSARDINNSNLAARFSSLDNEMHCLICQHMLLICRLFWLHIWLIAQLSLHVFMGQLLVLCRAAIKKVRTFLVLHDCEVIAVLHEHVYLWVVCMLAPGWYRHTYPHLSISNRPIKLMITFKIMQPLQEAD